MFEAVGAYEAGKITKEEVEESLTNMSYLWILSLVCTQPTP